MKCFRLCVLVIVVATAPAVAQNISLDKKLGAENALKVEQEMGLYDHDSLYRLINAVGQKLVSRLKNNPFEFKFFLADSTEPNAFALPGGYVYITRGILPLIQTEDELAGIMAHEIIHVTERHSIQQMQKDRIAGILQVPGNLVNKITRTRVGNIVNMPIGLSTKAFISKYSRGHEKDADAFGIQLAASAGYDPTALASALERLARGIEILTGSREKRDYFSDHPLTSSRITNIRKAAPRFKPLNSSPVAKSKEMFQKNFNGLCFGQNPKQGVFTDSLFIHPDLGFSWTVPSGWETVNKPAGVGAFTKKGDAVVTLSMAGPGHDVRTLGEEIKKQVMNSDVVNVQQAGDTLINSANAYLIRWTSKDKKDNAHVELVWIEFGGNVFLLAGVFNLSNKPVVHHALCSFRAAHQNELASVSQFELQFAQSRKSETISQLSERTNNRLNLSLTSLINDLNPQNPLDENVMIRIIRRIPYYTR